MLNEKNVKTAIATLEAISKEIDKGASFLFCSNDSQKALIKDSIRLLENSETWLKYNK